MRTFEELEAAAADGHASLDRLLLPAEAALEGFSSAYLAPAEVAKLAHGQAVPADPALPCGQVKVYADSGQLIAIGLVTAEHRLTPTAGLYSLTAWSGTEYFGMMRGFQEKY